MKKNLLTVLILALLIVNIALTAVMMISVSGTNKKTAALVETIATVMDLYESVHVAGDARETVAAFHEKALRAASKVTGIGGYAVLKQFADDLVDRVK